jgi:hypothetical protein
VQLTIIKAADADLLTAEIQVWLSTATRTVVAISVVPNPVESGLIAFIVYN